MARAGLSRDLLIREAAALIAERGTAALTMRALAERLGVRAPSLYNHIRNQQELLREVGVYALRELEKDIDAAQGASPKEQLAEIARRYRRFARREPALYEVLLHIPDTEDPTLISLGRLLGERVSSLTCTGLPEKERLDFMRAFRSALHGFTALEAKGFFSGADTTDRSFEYLIACLLEKLGE